MALSFTESKRLFLEQYLVRALVPEQHVDPHIGTSHSTCPTTGHFGNIVLSADEGAGGPVRAKSARRELCRDADI